MAPWTRPIRPGLDEGRRSEISSGFQGPCDQVWRGGMHLEPQSTSENWYKYLFLYFLWGNVPFLRYFGGSRYRPSPPKVENSSWHLVECSAGQRILGYGMSCSSFMLLEAATQPTETYFWAINSASKASLHTFPPGWCAARAGCIAASLQPACFIIFILKALSCTGLMCLMILMIALLKQPHRNCSATSSAQHIWL